MNTMIRKGYLYGMLWSCLITATCFAQDPAYVGRVPYSAEMAYKATQIQLQFYLVANGTTSSMPMNSCKFNGLPSWMNPPTFSAACASTVGSNTYTGTCNGKATTVVLPAGNSGGVCTLTMTFIGTPGSDYSTYTPSFSMSVGSRGQTVTSPTFQFSAASGANIGARTVTFKNYCSVAIAPGINPGATNPAALSAYAPNSPPNNLYNCTDSNQCYPGSTCLNPGASGLCFWKNPTITTHSSTGTYQLAAYSSIPDSLTVSFPIYDNGIEQQWSGNVAGRAGCGVTSGTLMTCTVSDCGRADNVGSCVVGQGFAKGPITNDEFILQGNLGTIPAYSPYLAGLTLYQGCGSTPGSCVVESGAFPVDYYDATIINGATIPFSVTPVGGVQASGDNYSCTIPGNPAAAPPLSAARWSFNPPNPEDYIWVAYNQIPGGGCTTGGGGADGCICSTGHTTCTGTNSKCGIAYNGSTLSQICGPDIISSSMPTYWTADEICVIDPTATSSIGTIFQCGGYTGQGGNTYMNLYACSAGLTTSLYAISCYNSSVNTCCGCVDWSKQPGFPSVPAPPCVGNNATWDTANITGSAAAQPYLVWLKQACPTCYVYPYDDKSSTFTCGNGVKNKPVYNNTTQYVVTFCPQNAPQ